MNIWNELPKHFLCLAPMEGVTDIVFRQVITKSGRPDLFFTEFTNVSSYASEKGRANALERLAIAPTDKPIIAQIWGKNPEHFAAFAHALEDLGFSGVDLNFGCPDRHVNKAGGGAAMIRTPELAVECIKNAKEASNLPISVKTRLGYTYTDEWHDWLNLLFKQNLAALTIHLRTRKEMSKVPAHFELIPEIIKMRNEVAPNTKLIINGDIKDKKQAEEIWQQYPEIDGIMIGRGVFQNPYCFTDHQPTREELIELLKLHLQLFDERINCAFEGDPQLRRGPSDEARDDGPEERPEKAQLSVSFEPLKHYFKIYVNNFPGASTFRAELMNCHDTNEAREVIKKFESC